MISLFIATRNKHKVEEIQALLGSGFRSYSLDALPKLPPIQEDQQTFAGNALKKARETAALIAALPERSTRVLGPRVFVLADDSGLEVDALRGAPGVHSARFAALDTGWMTSGNSSDSENNAKLLRLLEGVAEEERAARFRCVIACVQLRPAEPRLPDRTFEGTCEGFIQHRPAGRGGFGYDPLFVSEGQTLSFAELGAEVKNRLSHRFHALEKLKKALSKG